MLEYSEILFQEEIAPGIFSLGLRSAAAKEAAPGQFVSLYVPDSSKLLPRPISICEIHRETEVLRLVYRVTGEDTGTKRISQMLPGERLRLMGPLGRGFLLDSVDTVLIGGGIGIPPLLAAAKTLAGKKEMILGYRDHLAFLSKEFQSWGRVHIATEDGSLGTRGNVLDVLRERKIQEGRILACGPLPMLRGIKEYALAHGMECYLSLEERMACGIGACLACVCKSREKDGCSHVNNKRVCKEGPVFAAEEVEL